MVVSFTSSYQALAANIFRTCRGVVCQCMALLFASGFVAEVKHPRLLSVSYWISAVLMMGLGILLMITSTLPIGQLNFYCESEMCVEKIKVLFMSSHYVTFLNSAKL
jgi:hypothetical protein